MSKPDKGDHQGRPYHAVRGGWIVRAALVAALPGSLPRTEYELQDFTPHPYITASFTISLGLL